MATVDTNDGNNILDTHAAMCQDAAMLLEFWQFLVAVFWRWQSWAGGAGVGGAIVVFFAIYQQLTSRGMPKRMYVAIFIVGFLLFAVFLAWRDQYRAAQTAQQQLSELRLPIIRTSFVREPIIGIDPRDDHNTLLIVGLQLVNTGAPSALSGFGMKIVLSNGEQFELQPLHITVKPLELTDSSGRVISQIDSQNYLPKKVGETPIPHNGIAQGYLPYSLPGVNANEFAGLKADLYIFFFDANGKPYTAHGQYAP